MNNVFEQSQSLSQAIIDHIFQVGISPLKVKHNPEIFSVDLDPLVMLNSFGCNYSESAKLLLLDSPRASKRVPVSLYDFDADGSIIKREVGITDPNYKFLLSANLGVIAKLCIKALDYDGVLLAVTTPDVYMAVRGAFEHYFGVDKFIGELVYQSRSGGGSDSRYLSIDHETVLIFSKTPEALNRFHLDKTDSELKKYSLEDEISPYYWDTYIRKQARNYYPITCPDGSILELDNDGNKISWLWRKQTFDEKLAQKEIKFEKLNNQWKLYYKDRIKDIKILRSLAINSTLLEEVNPSFSGNEKGGDILNSKGSEEIKSYSGDKPDYLKPSTYFKFLYQTFNRAGGVTLIPYPDFGAAIKGIAKNSEMKSSLILNNPDRYNGLINWRVKQELVSMPIFFGENTTNSFINFFGENGSIKHDIILQLISIKYDINESWSEIKNKNLELDYIQKGDHIVIYLRSFNTSDIDEVRSCIKQALGLESLDNCIVFSEFEPDTIRATLFNNVELIQKVPDYFIS